MLLKTQTTRVQKEIVFRQRRQLQEGLVGKVTAHSGQEVTPVQIVARAAKLVGFHVFDLTAEHGLTAAEVVDSLLVTPGMEIQRGMPLLERKRRFRRKSVIKAPIDGLLEEVQAGRLFIRRRPLEVEVRSMLSGWVVYTIPNRGVSIETRAGRIDGVAGTNEEGYGQFKMLADAPGAIPNREEALAVAQGGILGFGHLNDVGLVEALREKGVRGCIVGTVTPEIYSALGRLSLPLVITDGVGRHGMTAPIFDLLLESAGREVALLAARYSHALRPLIIIPAAQATTKVEDPPQREPERGDRVRLLRTPYLGEIGQVVAIYPYQRDSFFLGAYVPTAAVRLPDGNVIVVPCANLDIIM